MAPANIDQLQACNGGEVVLKEDAKIEFGVHQIYIDYNAIPKSWIEVTPTKFMK